MDNMDNIGNVIIVGSGPAGYTAALYTSRANLSPLVIEGWMWGGLLQQTTDVENYPGFPEGIMGPELMRQFRDQAERFGTRFISDLATRIEPGADGAPHTVWVGDDAYKARTVILAMGAEHKKLGVPGEEELSGLGVSSCATCDAAFFKDRGTIIAGGGDSAATRRWRRRSSCRSSPPRSRSCTGAPSFGRPRSCSSARASRPTSSG
jgi:thioredoxin reductase (NADPH)